MTSRRCEGDDSFLLSLISSPELEAKLLEAMRQKIDGSHQLRKYLKAGSGKGGPFLVTLPSGIGEAAKIDITLDYVIKAQSCFKDRPPVSHCHQSQEQYE